MGFLFVVSVFIGGCWARLVTFLLLIIFKVLESEFKASPKQWLGNTTNCYTSIWQLTALQGNSNQKILFKLYNHGFCIYIFVFYAHEGACSEVTYFWKYKFWSHLFEYTKFCCKLYSKAVVFGAWKKTCIEQSHYRSAWGW